MSTEEEIVLARARSLKLRAARRQAIKELDGCIQKGIDYLDEEYPGWFDNLWPKFQDFDIANPERCVLGLAIVNGHLAASGHINGYAYLAESHEYPWTKDHAFNLPFIVARDLDMNSPTYGAILYEVEWADLQDRWAKALAKKANVKATTALVKEVARRKVD